MFIKGRSYRSFYPKGEDWDIGTYKGNFRDGEWITCAADGMRSQDEYRNGILVDSEILFDENAI